MNVTNIPKGFRWPTTLRYISMLAGESLKREEARKKSRKAKQAKR